jgi:hypothetical protein
MLQGVASHEAEAASIRHAPSHRLHQTACDSAPTHRLSGARRRSPARRARGSGAGTTGCGHDDPRRRQPGRSRGCARRRWQVGDRVRRAIRPSSSADGTPRPLPRPDRRIGHRAAGDRRSMCSPRPQRGKGARSRAVQEGHPGCGGVARAAACRPLQRLGRDARDTRDRAGSAAGISPGSCSLVAYSPKRATVRPRPRAGRPLPRGGPLHGRVHWPEGPYPLGGTAARDR